MSSSYSLKVQIWRVFLDIKFACTLNLQASGQLIGQSKAYEAGAFIMDCEFEIEVNGGMADHCWEVALVLKTSRGSTYNSGMFRLGYQELAKIVPNVKNSYNVAQSYDANCKIEFTIVKLNKNTSLQLLDYGIAGSEAGSGGNNFMAYRSESYVKQAPGEVKVSRGRKVVEEMQSEHSNKLNTREEYQLVSDAMAKIRKLQTELYLKQTQISELNNSVARFRSENAEQAQVITQLQQQNLSLAGELEAAHNMIRQDEQDRQVSNEQSWRSLNQMNSKFEHEHNEQVMELHRQLQQMRQQLSQKEQQCQNFMKQMEEMLQLSVKKDTSIRQLQNSNNQYQQKIKQCELKLKQVEQLSTVWKNDKQEANNRYRQARRELEQFKGLKNQHSILQAELTILKKSAENSVRHKDSVLDKALGDWKKKYDVVASRLISLQQAHTQGIFRYQQACEQLRQFNQKVSALQSKNKQLSRQVKDQDQMLEKLLGSQKQWQAQVINLNSAKDELQIKLKEMEQKQASLSQQVSNLNRQAKKMDEKIKQLEKLKKQHEFQMEKYKLQAALSTEIKDNSHSTCKQKQKIVRAELQRITQIKNAQEAQIITLKNSDCQNQRYLHELRLAEASSRENISNTLFKLNKSEKKIDKLEQEAKQSELKLSRLHEEKSKLAEDLKQSQNEIGRLKMELLFLKQQKSKQLLNQRILTDRHGQLQQALRCKEEKVEELQAQAAQLHKKIALQRNKMTQMQNSSKAAIKNLQRDLQKIKYEASSFLSISIEEVTEPIQQMRTKFNSQMSRAQSEKKELQKQKQKQQAESSGLQQKIGLLEEALFKKEEEIMQCEAEKKGVEQNLNSKQQQLASQIEQYNDLLSIHEEYIFTFNRYKLDKESEIQQLNKEKKTLALSAKESHQNSVSLLLVVAKRQEEAMLAKEAADVDLNRLRQAEKCNHGLIAEIESLRSQLLSETAKQAKLSTDLNQIQENLYKMTLQNQMLKANLEELILEYNKNKELVTLTLKSKDKTVRSLAAKENQFIALETQISQLNIEIQNHLQDRQNMSEEIKKLKENIKSLKVSISKLEAQNSELRQNLNKSQSRSKQRHLKSQQNNKRYAQLQQNLSKSIQGLQGNIRALNMEADSREEYIKKLKQQHYSMIQQLLLKQKQLNGKYNDLLSHNTQIRVKLQRLQQLQSQTQKKSSELLISARHEAEQLMSKMRELQFQVQAKQEALFSATGRLNEIEIQWQAQSKVLMKRQAEIERELHEKQGLMALQLQQKVAQEQAGRLSMERQLSKLTQQIRSKQKHVQMLMAQNSAMEEGQRQKETSHKQQINRIGVISHERLDKLQTKIAENQQQIKALRQQKQQSEDEKSELKSVHRTLKQQINQLKSQLQLNQEKIKSLQHIKEILQARVRAQSKAERENTQQIYNDAKRQFEITSKSLQNMQVHAQFASKYSELAARVLAIILNEPI